MVLRGSGEFGGRGGERPDTNSVRGFSAEVFFFFNKVQLVYSVVLVSGVQ